MRKKLIVLHLFVAVLIPFISGAKQSKNKSSQQELPNIL